MDKVTSIAKVITVAMVMTMVGLAEKRRRTSPIRNILLQTIIDLSYLVTLVKIAICKDSSLKEADTRIEEASRKMVMDFWIDQETHRHSHHNQADENWIVTIN